MHSFDFPFSSHQPDRGNESSNERAQSVDKGEEKISLFSSMSFTKFFSSFSADSEMYKPDIFKFEQAFMTEISRNSTKIIIYFLIY